MASFGKRQRDQERLAKAAQKRDRRQSRQSSAATESDSDSGASAAGESDNQAILAQIEALHRDFEAHRISFDDYEKQRDELLERIQI